MTKLCNDVLIFGFDHRLRHFEIVARGELVEKLALHVGSSEPIELLLELATDQTLQLFKIVKAERFGKAVV